MLDRAVNNIGFAARLLGALTAVVAASVSAAAVAADDNAAYRLLAERLAQDLAFGAPSDIDLAPGRLGQLPVPVTLPPGATVIGTVTVRPTAPNQYGSYQYTRYRVLFSAPGDAKSVVDGLAATLARSGYDTLPQRPEPAGFVTGGGFVANASAGATLCRKETDPSILVRAVVRNGRADGTIEETVPLAIAPGGGTPCSAMSRSFLNTARAQLQMPRLLPFAGVTLAPRSGLSSSAGSASQTVQVNTALSARDVLAQWAEQIRTQGWTQQGMVANETGALATFRRAEPNENLLLAISSEGANQYAAVLSARASDQQASTGGPR